MRLPYRIQRTILGVVIALVLGLAGLLWQGVTPRLVPAPGGGFEGGGSGQAESVFMAVWNVENFFDDHDDPANDDAGENWFARDAQARTDKVNRLTDALLRMNANRGPDILALVEVESVRAVELLRDELNRRFADENRPDLAYRHILFDKKSRDPRGIAPAILTRTGVIADRTRTLGRHFRILEGHLQLNGHPLVVIVSHWTSRVSDKTASRRTLYGQTINGRVRAILKENPTAQIVVCGDFNDEPSDPSVVKSLKAVADPAALSDPAKAANEGVLLNLCAGFDTSKIGTIEYNGQWQVFDHICVSAGLLGGQPWSLAAATQDLAGPAAQPPTAEIFAPDWMLLGGRRPWRFGGPNQGGARGYADHLPVTVLLRVAARAPTPSATPAVVMFPH